MRGMVAGDERRKNFRKGGARKRAVSGSLPEGPAGRTRVSFRKRFRKSAGNSAEVGDPSRRQPVAPFQADRQPEVLQLGAVDLERLRLPSERRGQVGGSLRGPVGDQLQNGRGPRSMRTGSV